MEKIVKRFDKKLGKFVSEIVDVRVVLKKAIPVANNEMGVIKEINISNAIVDSSNVKKYTKNDTAINLRSYQQKVFIEPTDIELINSMNDYVKNFDFAFFYTKPKDKNYQLFREKLYSIERRIENYFIVKKTKDNNLIDNAIADFKDELKGYKSLKEAIKSDLYKYKLDKSRKTKIAKKNYIKNKIERVSRFSHESYGCVLSISSGRRGSF